MPDRYQASVAIALWGVAASLLFAAIHIIASSLGESRWVRKWLDIKYAAWEEKLTGARKRAQEAKDRLAVALARGEKSEPKPTQPGTEQQREGTESGASSQGAATAPSHSAPAGSPHGSKKA